MDNPFKKIFDTGMAAFTSSKAQSAIGIDIGTSSIKVVQLKKKGSKAILETYGSLSLGPYADTEVGRVTNLPTDKISTALTDALRETNTTSKVTAFSIPSSASLLFVIELPASVPESQYGNVVPTEARKYVPVPINEVALDYWAIPKRDESFNVYGGEAGAKSEVLVAAIHNDILNRYKDILKRVDTTPKFYEIETFSAIRSSLGRDIAPMVFIDMGASKTKLSIIEMGVVRNFHMVNRGMNDLTSSISKGMSISYDQAEVKKRENGMVGPDVAVSDACRLFVDNIFAEISNTVLQFERKYNRAVTKVMFSGGGSLLPGLMEYAVSQFQSEVVFADPFSKVESPAFLEDVLRAGGPEFSIAVGLALRALE
ncbi:MAG TPA: type IV pilus assembly protein PilM [Candidatus Paceibacterota bacterium]|nr:type IV pilus assembly protein PilM [Candidatus Paceibacterota bacterium]